MKKIYLILALAGIFLMSGCITEEAEEIVIFSLQQ